MKKYGFGGGELEVGDAKEAEEGERELVLLVR